MGKFVRMIEPLTSLEKLILIIVLLWLIYLICDYLLRYYRGIKKRRMLLDYLRFKNEKWGVLLTILKNNNNVNSQYVKEQIEVDLSNFDKRYKAMIYRDLKKVKKFNHFNKSNFLIISRLLSNKRFTN